MRMVGEGKLIALKSPAEQRVERQKWVRVGKRKVGVTCVECKKEKIVNEATMYKFFKNKDYRCYDCNTKKRAQDKKEMNEALINLARRKGLIK